MENYTLCQQHGQPCLLRAFPTVGYGNGLKIRLNGFGIIGEGQFGFGDFGMPHFFPLETVIAVVAARFQYVDGFF